MPESFAAWWERRQRSKGVDVPYPVGSFRADWERYPVLIRQYHSYRNGGLTLTQIPPAAEVYLVWECDVGHEFVATPSEQRNRPGRERRRSVWCPVCFDLAAPGRRPSRPRRRQLHPEDHAVGEAFWSAAAPVPASAAEAELRSRIAERFDFDIEANAVRVAQPFFDRLEVWPDIVISDLRVAVEYDTIGRHGLEHVGRRDAVDRRKDRALRGAGWEVVRIRTGKLAPLGPYDIVVGSLTRDLMTRLEDQLGDIRGDLFVSAYRRIGSESDSSRRMG
jgi:hypothetical protein